MIIHASQAMTIQSLARGSADQWVAIKEDDEYEPGEALEIAIRTDDDRMGQRDNGWCHYEIDGEGRPKVLIQEDGE